MPLRYVVLKSNAPTRRLRNKGGAAPAGAPAEPTEFSVEMKELDSRAAAAEAESAGVEAVAPVIPLRLITPLPAGAGAEPAAAGSTWGVKAVGAETSTFTGDGAVVAVLDTGIDPTHPAFAGITLVRKNFTTEADNDLHGHGTHCAGTIAGRDVAGTRIGVARGVKKLVIGKVLGAGGGGSDTLIAAIQWAQQEGANVISMSLGIDFPGLVKDLIAQNMPVEPATSLALDAYRSNVMLFERLASLMRTQGEFGKPCIVIAAAGNESQRNGTPAFEIAVSPPAVGEGIVSVAALGQGPTGFKIASFSNTGARISGPGVDVMSAKAGGGLTTMSGTSMATPHVAGVAALWVHKLKATNSFNARLLSDRLLGSGTVKGLAAGFNPVAVGSGMVSAPQN